jgi:hypothetical protein
MTSTNTGLESFHSSTTPSTQHSEPHPQSDDSENSESHGSNIAGTGEMRTPYTWLSGKMDGWKENDDYREYFENSRGCDGMLGYGVNDGDYDDNGGMPTAVGHAYGNHGSSGISRSVGVIIGRL